MPAYEDIPLMKLPELIPGFPTEQMFSCADPVFSVNLRQSPRSISRDCPAWHLQDMMAGLQRVRQLLENGQTLCYPVYGADEIAADPRKAQTVLLHLPAERRLHRPFVLIMSGGAYSSVCTMAGALPVAEHLNRLGFDCFCLNYRTWCEAVAEKGLLPDPLLDIAAALRLIRREQALFGVDASAYAAVGFSAGGHAAALWGCHTLRARFGSFASPRALLLGYPMTDVRLLPDPGLRELMIMRMLGSNPDPDAVRQTDPSVWYTSEDPPVYLAKALDDAVVSLQDTRQFEAALTAAGVPHRVRYAETGGHGFGNGTGTPLADWLEDAVTMIRE